MNLKWLLVWDEINGSLKHWLTVKAMVKRSLKWVYNSIKKRFGKNLIEKRLKVWFYQRIDKLCKSGASDD